jgi:hypothetical protein
MGGKSYSELFGFRDSFRAMLMLLRTALVDVPVFFFAIALTLGPTEPRRVRPCFSTKSSTPEVR